jgi:hypothetical protein
MANDTDLNEFLDKYNKDGEHPVTVIDIEPAGGPRSQPSPFIIIRCGDKVALVNPLGFDDHLCVDIHSFVGDADATAGVFGMSKGRRWAFDETGTTSHKWNSASLISVLVGEQGEK